MTVPAFDYSSRDWPSLRQDMLDQISTRVPEWTDQSVNDFGVALIELFAYVGDVLSYYGDRIANEAYLQTATQRANVLTIAKMLDYTPGGNIAASAVLTLTNSSGTTQVIPIGTQVSTTTGDQVFETVAAVTVVGSGGTNTVTALQGNTVTSEALGTSNGALDQNYSLFNTPVIDGSVKIYVNNGSGPVLWYYLEHLIDGTPTSTTYTLYTDANNVVHIGFGDNVNGLVPTIGATITATYRLGGGVLGNVGPNTLNRFVSAVPAGITVNNTLAAAGGGDYETLDSIRTNAPKSLFSLNRAVTNSDYAQLALRVSGVAKANAVAAVYNSVTVYIAPTGGGGLQGDNITPTTQLAAVQSNVANYFVGKAPASATISVGSPFYVPINITLTVQVNNSYNQDVVRTAVTTALSNYLLFDKVSFAQRLALADVYALVMAVPGVLYTNISIFSRTSTGLADIQLAANEIATSVSATTSVTATGGIVVS